MTKKKTKKQGAGRRAQGAKKKKNSKSKNAGGKKQSNKQKRKEPVVRWAAIGGLEEIGRNMMFFEYEDEIFIIDAGLEFPTDETPGIDYIIPETDYLEKNKDKIRGLIITHGHYDHIGAIPYVLEKLNNPLIYCTPITREVVRKRQEDYPNSPKPKFKEIAAGDTHKISENFEVEFFAVEHNIPEGVGMLIKTPIGEIVHPGEFKFDYDEEGNAKGMDTWERLGRRDIHTLFLDSTASEVPGWSTSERVVERELEKLMAAAEGRIIVATFASLLDRLAEIIKIGEKYNRKVLLDGRSLRTNVAIVRKLGYMKVKDELFIKPHELKKYKDSEILVLATGAQAEQYASLTRISNGSHKWIKLKKSDTIIFSSSVVPGNEVGVQELRDNLSRKCPNIYHSKMLDIHSSGHAPMEELKTVMKLVKPKNFLPIHGYYFMRFRNIQHAQEMLGLKDENTAIPDNGDIVEFTKDGIKVTDETIPSGRIMVDGLGVGDVQEIVLRDRLTLSESGMVVIIATIDKKTAKLVKNPDIISRGFVYLDQSKDLLNQMRQKVKSTVKQAAGKDSGLNVGYTKGLLRDQIGSFVYSKTERRPLILPVIIEV